MASYLPTTGWLYNPVEISIDLDQLHSLGELPDEGQSGAEGVDPEAFVVPDGCFTGRAWGYSRLGGRVVGRVVVRAVQPGSRVWYEGLQVSCAQLCKPYRTDSACAARHCSCGYSSTCT